jgi:glycosyltransferase involved in cell wall biosynthesis
VTVVYNGAATLRRTLDSVLRQGYEPLEYIVVDGGSTDGTLDLLREYDDRLTYWVSERDGGIYDAMNKGIALANGEVIGLINSDDYYADGAIARVVSRFAGAPAPDLVYGNIWHRPIGLPEGAYVPPHPLRKDHFHAMPIPHAATFVTRGWYERVGVFDTSLRLAGDFEFVLRSFAAGARFDHLDCVLAVVAGGGLSDSQARAYFAETKDVLVRRDMGVKLLALHHVARARSRLIGGAGRSMAMRSLLQLYRRLRTFVRSA